MQKQRIFSVSELTTAIRGILETQFSFISVTGEISNLRKPHSGHIYFTLKDSQAQIKGVLFKMQQRYLSQQPRNGQQVVCRGRLSVYEPRGDYQLIVDSLDFVGTGALQIAFEQLKTKLAAQGIFAQNRKKSPPIFPDHITIVTSPGGAALHDFSKIARKRFPRTTLEIFPVAVQGDKAAGEICRAIELINKSAATEIIVLCRGGGSIEDLWPFNEEKVAQAIYNSEIMIVNAVGHEIDYTIADFAADMRAPTPSAAAELLLPDQKTLKTQLEQTGKKLTLLINSKLNTYSSHLTLYKQIIGDMSHPLENLILKLDHNSIRIEQAITQEISTKQIRLNLLENQLQQKKPDKELELKQSRLSLLRQRLLLAEELLRENKQKKLANLAGILDAISPLATLARGYSITRQQETGKIIINNKQAPPGNKVEIVLHQGRLKCIVEESFN